MKGEACRCGLDGLGSGDEKWWRRLRWWRCVVRCGMEGLGIIVGTNFGCQVSHETSLIAVKQGALRLLCQMGGLG